MNIFLKNIRLFIAFAAASVLVVGCKDDENPVPGENGELTITQISPSTGAPGMRVAIIGENFSETATENTVAFNGTAATVTEASATSLTVTVPEGVTTGPVSVTVGGETVQGPVFTLLDEGGVNLGDGFTMDAGIATIGQAFIYEDEAMEDVTALRLTPASSDRVGVAYYGARIPVANGFETTFDFRVSRPGRPEGQSGEVGAEGFAFIIQNESLEARGHRGGSMGYAGINNAVAIEFDIFQNVEEGEHPNGDPNGNHISVQANLDPEEQYGPVRTEIYHSLGHTTGSTHPELPEFIGNESQRHTARIVYTPGEGENEGLLQVYVDDMTTPLEVSMNLEDYVTLENGKAYVGFTASTGMDWGWAAHDILNWTLQPNTDGADENE